MKGVEGKIVDPQPQEEGGPPSAKSRCEAQW